MAEAEKMKAAAEERLAEAQRKLKPIMWDGYPITANIAFKKGAAERITFDKTNMGESEGFRVKNTTFDLSGFEADDTVIIHIINDTVTVSKGI